MATTVNLTEEMKGILNRGKAADGTKRPRSNFPVAMGCELTFTTSILMQIYRDHDLILWNHKGSDCLDVEHNICNVLVRKLRALAGATGYSGIDRQTIHANHNTLKTQQMIHRIYNDPHCVEVTTQPMASKRDMMGAIRYIYSLTKQLPLTPTNPYNDHGGGCHIHTNIPYAEYSQRVYYQLYLTYYMAQNPWLHWAFSGSHARTFWYECGMPKIQPDKTLQQIKQLRQDIRQLKHHIEQYKSEVVTYRSALTNCYVQLHAATTWSNPRSRERTLYDMDCQRRWLLGAMKRLVMYPAAVRENKKQLAALLKQYRLERKTPQLKKLYDMAFTHNGAVADKSEYGTMEFRIFRMPKTLTEHSRHLDVTAAIVEKAIKATQRAIKDDYKTLLAPVPQYDVFKKMKYSERKEKFNEMLMALGLEPKRYRTQCVRMALKMRYERVNGDTYL